MFPVPVNTVEDCGNGYGWSIVYLQGQEVYEIAILKNGKYVTIRISRTTLSVVLGPIWLIMFKR